jgi:hypothetical protein
MPTNPASAAAAPPLGRRHDIDALRVLAFGLLILYHTAMAYVADWGWHVKSTYISTTLQLPMLLLNRWRMPLLFLISGVALSFLLRRTPPTTLARQRSSHLLLPLLFGMLVVVPIQPYCQALAKGIIEPGFGHFLIRYFTFQPWPAKAFDGSDVGITWNHLWYLPYLWAYTMLLLALQEPLHSALGQRIANAFTGLRGLWLLVLPGLPKTLALITLSDRFPGTNNLVWDWYQHALYFAVFLYGYWLGAHPAVWQELQRLRRVSLGLALLVFSVYGTVIYLDLLEDPIPGWLHLAWNWLSGLNMWLWLATVLGWGHHLLNRPFRWLPYANEAIFPWYMLHQSIIVALVFWLAPLHLGPIVEPLLVIAGTVSGCALAHEFLIRRNRWLRPLFGLKPLADDAAAIVRPLPADA